MNDFAGLKALVVEDEGSVALLIEDMLDVLGCEVAASVARVSEACELARTASFDFAMLDVNLAGESVLPVANVLRERRIPFLFSTGYGKSGVPDEFDTYPVLSKPYGIADLKRVLSLALSKPDA